MEVKLVKCETCLSSDRQLVCVAKMKSILAEIQLPQILNTDGGVCWECHRVILKYCKFRVQVKYAQEQLSRNIAHYRKKQIKSLSHLSSNIKQNYDFEYSYYDPLINAIEENIKDIKAEPIVIKQEALYFDDRFNSDTDYDDKPLSMVFADSIKIKNLTKQRKMLARSTMQDKKKLNENILTKKNHLNKEHDNEDNKIFFKKGDEQKSSYSKKGSTFDEKRLSIEVLKEKFETVIFTEEEMLKCREDKRNQANFKKIPYNCSTCVIGFTKKENYDTHLKKIHDESIGPHACAVCSARFASGAAAVRHRTAHYVRHRCRLCAYSARSGAAAVRHARQHRAVTAPCTHCTFLARTASELSDHVKSVHSFACDKCGIKFKGKHTLRTHNARIHAVKREFSCDVCSRTFVSKSRLESHAATHSAAAAKRLAYCVQCRVQYKSIYVYRNHLKNSVNHVQDRIPCPSCDKMFASRVYWKRHYAFYHLRASQHKCLDCDKLFMSRWRLKVHRQTRHGLTRTRDHACSDCGKAFYTKATLSAHSLLHAGSLGFMCARCGATFRQRAALYAHARRAHRACAA